MLKKEEKNKLLNLYNKKEERIFANKVLDLICKADNYSALLDQFLDLSELEIAIVLLNRLNVSYKIFKPILDSEKVILVLNADETEKKIINQKVSAIKIVPSAKGKLKHKDYMGAVFSLGISNASIGDIIAFTDVCYAFVLKNMEEYIMNNLSKVGNVPVDISKIDIFSDEVCNLKIATKEIKLTVNSLRVDLILATLFNAKRSMVQTKIEEGDLFINSKQQFFVATNLKENDIVSFKRHGKFKVGKILGVSRSGKTNLMVYKYI